MSLYLSSGVGAGGHVGGLRLGPPHVQDIGGLHQRLGRRVEAGPALSSALGPALGSALGPALSSALGPALNLALGPAPGPVLRPAI